jgi:hypothetical protein
MGVPPSVVASRFRCVVVGAPPAVITRSLSLGRSARFSARMVKNSSHSSSLGAWSFWTNTSVEPTQRVMVFLLRAGGLEDGMLTEFLVSSSNPQCKTARKRRYHFYPHLSPVYGANVHPPGSGPLSAVRNMLGCKHRCSHYSRLSPLPSSGSAPCTIYDDLDARRGQHAPSGSGVVRLKPDERLRTRGSSRVPAATV